MISFTFLKQEVEFCCSYRTVACEMDAALPSTYSSISVGALWMFFSFVDIPACHATPLCLTTLGSPWCGSDKVSWSLCRCYGRLEHWRDVFLSCRLCHSLASPRSPHTPRRTRLSPSNRRERRPPRLSRYIMKLWNAETMSVVSVKKHCRTIVNARTMKMIGAESYEVKQIEVLLVRNAHGCSIVILLNSFLLRVLSRIGIVVLCGDQRLRAARWNGCSALYVTHSSLMNIC